MEVKVCGALSQATALLSVLGARYLIPGQRGRNDCEGVMIQSVVIGEPENDRTVYNLYSMGPQVATCFPTFVVVWSRVFGLLKPKRKQMAGTQSDKLSRTSAGTSIKLPMFLAIVGWLKIFTVEHQKAHFVYINFRPEKSEL